jgi:hypothetical protein
MLRRIRRLGWLFAVGLWLNPAYGRADEQTAPALSPPAMKSSSAEDISRWIKNLDDDSFEARDEATLKLIESGTAGLPALRDAMNSPSQETSGRATEILRRLSLSEDKPTANAARSELEKVRRSSNAELAAKAEDAIRSLTPDPPQGVVPNFRMGRQGRWRGAGEIQLAPGAQLVLEGGLSHSIRITNVNGKKTIDVSENQRRIRIEEDSRHENIRISVTDIVDGKDAKTETFEAKNREQLSREHKEQCVIYDQYATDQQGMLNVQIRGIGNAGMGMPFPNLLRAQLPLAPAERRQAADATREARSLLEQARKKLPQDRAGGPDGWQEALDQLDAAEKKLGESLRTLDGDEAPVPIGP